MVHKTLNQIIKEIDNFATNHLQVNSFGVGRIWDFATSGDTKYPALWVDYADVSINNVYGSGSSTETTPVRVYISDRLQKGAFNEQEVLSDIRETFFDLIAYISNDAFEWTIGSSVTLTRFGEEFQNDEIAGYYCEIQFTQSFLKDRCAIPYITNP